MHVQLDFTHSCRTKEPSILLSKDNGDNKLTGEYMSLKLDVDAGLNS